MCQAKEFKRPRQWDSLKGSGQGNEKIRFIFWGYLASVWRMKWRGTKAPRKLLEKFRQEQRKGSFHLAAEVMGVMERINRIGIWKISVELTRPGD